MRIVMMGTGPFAVPTFKQLFNSRHELACLVTRPDAGQRSRRNRISNPMRQVAEQHDLTIHEPSNVNDPAFVKILEKVNADLFVVCDYGQILSKACLSRARLGGINLHGSLLPKYRGAAPINWAIYEGETETGVTVIHMTAKLDGGPMLVQRVTPIDGNETAVELEPRMAESGVAAVVEAIDVLEEWDGERSIGIKQVPGEATRAPRLQKSDGLIDWNRTAKQIVNQIRAFKPWPGTYGNLLASAEPASEPIRLIIHEAIALEQQPANQPGTVEEVVSDRLLVSANESVLDIREVQPAGKRQMKVADFLRGRTIRIGDQIQ